MSRRVAIAATLSGVLLASGCATPPSMSSEQRAQIRSVSIAKPVRVPAYPMVFGPSSSTAHFLLGPIGLAASMHSENPDSQALKKLMDFHRIDIGEIVRGELAAQLADRVEVTEERGDATFEIVVESFGLGQAVSMRPINAPLRPTLALSAKLAARDGAVLWQKEAYITALNGAIESRKFDQILADPARVQQDFGSAAQIVVKELLQDVGGFASYKPAPTQTAAASAKPAGAPGLPHTGPLPAPGTTWVYGFADRQFGRSQTEVTVRVLRVDGAMVEEALAASGQGADATTRVVIAREPRIFEHRLGSNAVLIEIAPYLLAVHDGKGSLGISQEIGYPQGQAGMAPWIVTVRELGWEKIAVPAGSFQALRVEINGRRQYAVSAAGQVGRFSIVVWYSPEVKRSIKLEHRTWSTFLGSVPNGHDVVELLSYRPPS